MHDVERNLRVTPSTLLLLGGSRLLLPVIDAAHARGIRVVTCDYLPHNDAHPFADEYRNVSIIDAEAVLAVAREVGADGIMSFAADPGVLAAAYAAEQLGLPFQGSYETVRVLQTKDLFRAFLAEHGFVTPRAVPVGLDTDLTQVLVDVPLPVIVKPVDSAGSKGVSRVDTADALSEAIEFARSFSFGGKCIVEQFIESDGPSLSAEAFTVDGEVVTIAYMDQCFDDGGSNPYAPFGNIVPSQATPAALGGLTQQLQRLATVLQLRSGIYNVEARIDAQGNGYLMEVSPRGGGNRLAELVRAASGVDLIGAAVDAALGRKPQGLAEVEYDGVWHNRVLFSRHGGTYHGVQFTHDFGEEHVHELTPWIAQGDRVESFSASNHAFGSAFLRFSDRTELAGFLADPDAAMKVVIS